MQKDNGRGQKSQANEIKQLAVELRAAAHALASSAVSDAAYRSESEELIRRIGATLADLEKLI